MRYKLSYRDVEEFMAERGINMDHSTVNRWVLKYAPLLTAEARLHKRNVGVSWRLDETWVANKPKDVKLDRIRPEPAWVLMAGPTEGR